MDSSINSRSSSPTPSLTNLLQHDGSWTVKVDDLYIDEEKLQLRLHRIYDHKVSYSWHLNEYVIENAPRAMTEVSLFHQIPKWLANSGQENLKDLQQ
jgi:hypothetical protein